MTSIDDRRRQQQHRAVAILMSIVLVAIVAVDVVAIALHGNPNPRTTPIVAGALPTTTGSASPGPVATTTPVPTDVLAALTGVSPAVESQVGSGSSSIAMKQITAAALGSTPKVLFVGAEFCPFCASERWSIIQALSRFGTFSGLVEIRSSEGNLPTFDFATATFTSSYLTFDPIELEGEDHQQIGKLTKAQLALFNKYSGAFPFLYVDGHYVQSGAGFDPDVLSGLDQRQVAASLANPTAATTQSIVGEANVLTAAICDTTNNQPTTACSNSAVVALEEQLSGALPS